MTGPITNQTLRVSRGPYELHAELTPGSGPPVVLMHGFPDSTHLYDRLVPYLAGRSWAHTSSSPRRRCSA